MVQNNILIITTLHSSNFKTFLKNIYFLFRKYRINLHYKNTIIKKKKSTILRSPHVHKNSRDQIEYSFSKNIFTFKNNNLIFFFFFIFKQITNIYFKFVYKKQKKQDLIIINDYQNLESIEYDTHNYTYTYTYPTICEIEERKNDIIIIENEADEFTYTYTYPTICEIERKKEINKKNDKL